MIETVEQADLDNYELSNSLLFKSNKTVIHQSSGHTYLYIPTFLSQM